jgi:hypothetical protein
MLETLRSSCPTWRRAHLLAIALGASAPLTTGCGDGATATGSAAAASVAPTAEAAPTASAPRKMPVLTVDSLGPHLDGQRADMKNPDGPAGLKKIVAGLPIDGTQVTLVTLKKSKTRDVLAVVSELGAAGVPTVLIKTDGRNDLPQELVVVPSTKVTEAPPACSVVGTLGDDLQTRVWSLKGGTAKLSKKGFAGPDFSLTGGAAKRDIERCTSDTVLFSGDPTVDWELTFNLGGTLVSLGDPEKKIKTIILLGEAPVAGRPVKVP